MDLLDRSIDEYGKVYYTPDQLVNMIMSGYDVTNFSVTSEKDVTENNNSEDLNIKKINFYQKNKSELTEYFNDIKNDFIIPDNFMSIDLYNFLLSKCNTQEEYIRIEYEYNLIVKKDMINFFKCIIYLVDFFRNNDILWGVGRGSSVSSYALYLIGIHKINSIKYNLDCHEFFK